MAVIGTLSALVVGLLISTANSSFIAKAQEIADISADVISLDRLMQRFGSEAQDGRMLLRHYTAAELQDLFPENSDQAPNMENIATVSMLEELQNKIVALVPANDTQRWVQAQSLQLTTAIMAARWQLAQGTVSTPRPLLVLVLFWFVIIFASFGLFAPLNATSIVAILLCSVGVGSAIRIITELQEPFGGLIEWEFPRLCRGGSRSLTFPGVCPGFSTDGTLVPASPQQAPGRKMATVPPGFAASRLFGSVKCHLPGWCARERQTKLG
jgi:hypothetical protein